LIASSAPLRRRDTSSGRGRISLAAGLSLLACLAGCATAPETARGPAPTASAATGPEARTAAYFAGLGAQSPERLAFLRAMPKGGDLHNHLSGAIYAENWLRWAAEDGLCADLASPRISNPPCDAAHGRPPAASLTEDSVAYGKMVDGLSMRNPPPQPIGGHDRFFQTFGRFSAKPARAGDQLAEVAARLARENTFYVELMSSPGMGDARALGQKLPWSEDFASMLARLDAAGLPALAERTRHDYDAAEARLNEVLKCGTPAADPGCRVTIRYLAQIPRTFPLAQIFAQTALGVALAAIDRRVVGLNLVAPEDDPRTLADYAEQMRIVGFLTGRGEKTNVALHAGELAPGLVPPEDLRFHIRQAVEIAGAKRIGHGVDIGSEDDPTQLLAEMRDRQVLVEINLTSNDVILGISGPAHPLPLYRRSGVPFALSTDDAGVSRIDLTHEYQRAAADFGLGYGDLKVSARNALAFSFLAGSRLAEAPDCAAEIGAEAPSSPACSAFLAANDKAREEWRLEAAFRRFEATARPAP
jgi:adenosine deaminase